MHRRSWLHAVLLLVCLGLAVGFGWATYDRRDALLAVPTVVLFVFALIHLRAIGDPRTPLFVADDHGVRLRSEDGWVGLLWSELGEIRVEHRELLVHDPRIKVVSNDGLRIYSSPLGVATNVSPGEAEVQLAQRRPAAAY